MRAVTDHKTTSPVAAELILGIETSCDDTSVALVHADTQVVAMVTRNQHAIHNVYGGVYPEHAHQAHVRALVPVLHETLAQAQLREASLRTQLAAIAVTRGPGLLGGLFVGIRFAQGLGCGWEVPVIGVNHLRGHVLSPRLNKGQMPLPALVLLVSGGHTLLAHLDSEARVHLLGSTRDDAVGEAYDKVARMLGLSYPGGREIDRRYNRVPEPFRLPRPMLAQGLEFSFAGLKTAVMRRLAREKQPLSEAVIDGYCTAFVNACVETLVTKCDRALSQYPAKALVAVGGVAASTPLRAALAQLAQAHQLPLCVCERAFATDNAAMIALTGWEYFRNGRLTCEDADPTLRITQW